MSGSRVQRSNGLPQERSSIRHPIRAKFIRDMTTLLNQVQPVMAFAAAHLDEDVSG